jgi:flagellar hook-length control protein FliK
VAPGPTAPVDHAPAPPTAGTTSPAVPAPGPAPLGGALSAGADGTGQESAGSGSPSGDGGTEVTAAGIGAPAAAAATPGTDVDAATGPAATQPVSAQVARQVAVLRGAADGSHTMTLVLTPETLGPVEVSVTVSSGTVDLTLRGANEHGRAALLDALPDLRRDLELAGLSVARAEVDRDTGGSRFSDQPAQYADRQQAFGDRGGQDRGNSRSRPWLGAADTTGGPTPAAERTTSSGVDVRV